MQKSGSVKVPDYSHSPDTVYAIVQDGVVKTIGVYRNHIKVSSIDLRHEHTNKDGTSFKEHVHTDLHHSKDARALSKYEELLVKRANIVIERYLK